MVTSDSEDLAARSSRRAVWRWIVALATVAVLAAGGAIIGSLADPQFTAQVRLAVGPESFAAQSVPGYAVASQTLAANYARYVRDDPAGIDTTESAAGLAPGSITSLSASPIPESNVLFIEAVSPSPDAAVKAVDEAARALVDQVNAPPPEMQATRDNLRDAAESAASAALGVQDSQAVLDQALAAGDGDAIADARRALASAQADLAVLQAEQSARQGLLIGQYQTGASTVSLAVVRPGSVVEDSRASTLQWAGLAGLALGAVVAIPIVGRRPAAGRARSH